jgi:hypothetical protein
LGVFVPIDLFTQLAATRPLRTFGLTVETSELLAKADFGTSMLADDDAGLQNQIPGSSFGGELPSLFLIRFV